jgi:hypothetical protein
MAGECKIGDMKMGLEAMKVVEETIAGLRDSYDIEYIYRRPLDGKKNLDSRNWKYFM